MLGPAIVVILHGLDGTVRSKPSAVGMSKIQDRSVPPGAFSTPIYEKAY
jgi:hypothetical protein